jgi:hypothetical protein
MDFSAAADPAEQEPNPVGALAAVFVAAVAAEIAAAVAAGVAVDEVAEPADDAAAAAFLLIAHIELSRWSA